MEVMEGRDIDVNVAFERESRSNVGLRGETASWETFRRIFRSIHLMGLPPGPGAY